MSVTDHVRVLSDFTKFSDSSQASPFGPVLLALNYFQLCCEVLCWVVFSKRSFHVHYVSRYSLVSLLIPSSRLYSYPYGSDVQVAPLKNRWLKRIISANLQRSQMIIVSSHALRLSVVELVSSKEILVVPFGVERKLLVKKEAIHPQALTSKLVVGCFKYCRIDVYGLDRLLNIFNYILNLKNGQAELRLIDSGPDTKRLKLIIDNMELSSNVVFLPSVDTPEDVFRYLEEVDVTIYPSRRESFGVSLLESMAAGKPSFVSEVGGMAEIVSDNENGFFCHQDDFEVTAQMVCSLVDDPVHYKKVATKARSKVESDFAWEECFSKFYETFRVQGLF